MKLTPMIAVSLTGFLLLGASFPVYGDELTDTMSQQKQVNSQVNQAKENLNTLSYSADKLTTQIKTLENEVATAQQELNRKKTAYNQSSKALEKQKKELQETQETLKKKQKVMRQRLRYIYMEGGTEIQYLDLLFRSQSLGDFLTNMEYLVRLVNYDKKIVTDLEAQQVVVNAKFQELEAVKSQAEVAKNESEKASQSLLEKQNAQKSALAQNEKNQKDLLTQISKLQADSQAMTQKIKALQAAQSKKNGSNKTGTGTISTWAVPGHTEISSPYGWRTHPITKNKSMHTGIDIPAPSGATVAAAGDGVVLFTGWYGAYGNSIIIDHGKGYSTLYAHLSSIETSEGASVKAGNRVGGIGSTGWSTGPHLHFEVRLDGNPTNPSQYYR